MLVRTRQRTPVPAGSPRYSATPTAALAPLQPTKGPRGAEGDACAGLAATTFDTGAGQDGLVSNCDHSSELARWETFAGCGLNFSPWPTIIRSVIELGQLRWTIYRRVGEAIGLTVVLPGTALLVAVYLGLDLDFESFERLLTSHAFSRFGPLVLLVISIRVAVETAFREIKQDRKKAASDFYAISSSARIDRAHHVFYRLYNEGKTAQHATPERRQEWDQQVIRALTEHCTRGYLSIYLLNTGRTDPALPVQPMTDERFPDALSQIEMLLDRELPNAIGP